MMPILFQKKHNFYAKFMEIIQRRWYTIPSYVKCKIINYVKQ